MVIQPILVLVCPFEQERFVIKGPNDASSFEVVRRSSSEPDRGRSKINRTGRPEASQHETTTQNDQTKRAT